MSYIRRTVHARHGLAADARIDRHRISTLSPVRLKFGAKLRRHQRHPIIAIQVEAGRGFQALQAGIPPKQQFIADRFITNNRRDFGLPITEIDVVYPDALDEP